MFNWFEKKWARMKCEYDYELKKYVREQVEYRDTFLPITMPYTEGTAPKNPDNGSPMVFTESGTVVGLPETPDVPLKPVIHLTRNEALQLVIDNLELTYTPSVTTEGKAVFPAPLDLAKGSES